jgi:hypothetical protein
MRKIYGKETLKLLQWLGAGPEQKCPDRNDKDETFVTNDLSVDYCLDPWKYHFAIWWDGNGGARVGNS